MLGLGPLGEVYDALFRRAFNYIFIGDINQLPPVFGPSIMKNYALVQLPIVELKKSTGIRYCSENAHHVLKGETWKKIITLLLFVARIKYSTWPRDYESQEIVIL